MKDLKCEDCEITPREIVIGDVEGMPIIFYALPSGITHECEVCLTEGLSRSKALVDA